MGFFNVQIFGMDSLLGEACFGVLIDVDCIDNYSRLDHSLGIITTLSRLFHEKCRVGRPPCANHANDPAVLIPDLGFVNL